MHGPDKGFALIVGHPQGTDFKSWLAEEIGPFNAELLIAPGNRSRCTILDNRALVVLRVARSGADTDDVGRHLLTLWIERGRVIAASEINLLDLLGIEQWQQGNYAPVSSADLVARLALRAADRIEPLIEHLGNSLDNVEESLMRGQAKNSRDRLSRLRRNIVNFRRLVWPLRDVLNTLEIEDLPFLTARDRVRLRAAAARTDRLGDELQVLSERAVLVHEQLLDTRAEELNRSMLILASVTVVLMPLTVISGMLGMNLAGIPFADSPYAFWIVAGGLVMLGIATYLWLHKRKWL
ncbi:MAG TPA: zinc transporter ZntB [Alphaproteobacteria bacterium]|nr:zinc transporter ZntB [Alphaproteobacteria bacterium]